jgi:hypothetical protein
MAYNPDEPRDEHGKWAHGGGSGHYDKLTVNSLLDDPHVAKPRSRLNPSIAKELNARGQAALKELGIPSGVIKSPEGEEPSDPKENNILSSAVASEVEHELSGDHKHAEDWYTTGVQDAMNIAEKMHPEMKNNPTAKFAYTAAMAITSQTQNVNVNAASADKIYEFFEKNAKFPTDMGTGKSADEINANFEKLNKLIAEGGVAGTIKFLDTEFTAGELIKMGYTVTGENVGAKVYGSAILGPKIGQGFYQNLNGNFKPLTADMWLMRAWGRLTGTLTGTVDVAKPQAKFEAALKAGGQKIPSGRAALVKRAAEIRLAHTRDFINNRAEFDAGTKTKSKLIYAAERYELAVNGIKDQPSGGGQRQHIRDVFDQAQQKLAEAGHKMTTADMQATWWYPEQRLYRKMGSRNPESLSTNYGAALRALAAKKGIKL